MTRTSIVVPSRGGAARLPVLLDSVAAQQDLDVEVIVVVDGDVDGSEQVLARRPESWVRSIVFPENRGRAAALNAGFDAASGEILVRCDDDLELEPDFVGHHRALHAESVHGVITLCAEVFERETPYSRVFGGPADQRIHAAAKHTVPDQRWRWWSGCVSTTRSVYDRVGPYDVTFRRYGWEDIDWGYRLHLTGVPIVIPDGFRTRHHGPVTSVRERAQRAFHSGASRLTFEAIHGDDSLAAPISGIEAPRTLWTRLVEVTSALATERSVITVGSALDRVISTRAPRLSEKAVSLLVEASSEAGRRHPERITSTF